MSVIDLSVDIGFGDTKYTLKKDNEEIKEKFPTAIEKVSIKAKDDEDVYNFGGKISYYRVGERALRNASITRDMDYLTKFAPLIVYHILNKNSINMDEIDELRIRTGISLFYYRDYKEKFKESLKQIPINNAKEKIKIKIFAQGQGILYDYLDKNKNITYEEIIVNDIGYNTIDSLHFIKNEKGIYNPFRKNCFGIDEGAFLAVSELKDYIEETYDINITEQQANEILRKGTLKAGGEVIDLLNIINEIKTSYTEKIINDIIKVRKNLIRSVDKVLFGGGGAYFLDLDELKKVNKSVEIVEKPEFANVRGYFLK